MQANTHTYKIKISLLESGATGPGREQALGDLPPGPIQPNTMGPEYRASLTTLVRCHIGPGRQTTSETASAPCHRAQAEQSTPEITPEMTPDTQGALSTTKISNLSGGEMEEIEKQKDCAQ